MPLLNTKTTATHALVVISTVVRSCFVIAVLYIAREILMPFALAALLAFLLSPLVSRIERWLGRVGAVLVVVTLIFTATGLVGWVLARQAFDLAAKLPDYKENIVTKLHAFRVPQSGAFTVFSQTLEELKNELPGGSEQPGRTEPGVPAPPAAVSVRVEAQQNHPMTLVAWMIPPLLGSLGTAALVLLLVIFMLLQREELRNRLIRLVGQGRISATSRAMDDAGTRVSRYLLMQLVVNVTYGIPVAIGLYFIGVPNAILWGGLAAVLRFIPYVGPWIAAFIPIFLSLAVSASWWTPALTISLFVVLELLSNNVMEPWLYGSSTGVAPIALIVAAVFWAWLWGPVGLVLATPLTVCLVVMGRYVPRLAFLSVVLSDEEALTPAEDCYNRLLKPGDRDELDLVESYLNEHSLCALYDEVFIPVLIAAETDARVEALDREQLGNVEQAMRDIIEDLGTRPVVSSKDAVTEADAAVPPVAVPECSVYCLPARAERDEIAGTMLVQLARSAGFRVQSAAAKLVAGELLALVEKADVDVICISVVAPSTVLHARYLCLKLRALSPRLKIVVGLWGSREDNTESTKRLRDSGAEQVVTTLAEALVQMARLAPPLQGEVLAVPIPADEEERLAALLELNLLNTVAEPVFDRITSKLARVLEMPIALLSLMDRDRQFFKSQIGLPEVLAKSRQMARDVSVCEHVVASKQGIVVEDLARDRRFVNLALHREHGVRFYAGVPLLAPNGQPVGSLCLMDRKPRQLTDRDKRLLQEYANDVMEEIASRLPLTGHGGAAGRL